MRPVAARRTTRRSHRVGDRVDDRAVVDLRQALTGLGGVMDDVLPDPGDVGPPRAVRGEDDQPLGVRPHHTLLVFPQVGEGAEVPGDLVAIGRRGGSPLAVKGELIAGAPAPRPDSGASPPPSGTSPRTNSAKPVWSSGSLK